MDAEQLALVSGLFTRVGYFVSHSEDTDDTEKSEDQEKAYMLKAFARIQNVSKSPLIAKCAGLALEDSHINLDETEQTLTRDIQQAVTIFQENETPLDLAQFQGALMFVGKSVARAYREELDHHEEEFLLETLMNKIAGVLNKDADPDEHKDDNISPAEDTALTLISEALKVQKEQP